jgi:hypothetical protein
MNEAKWRFTGVNITNRFKAELLKNRLKGKNITEPIVSKSFTGFPKSQNVSYLENRNHKTISFYINLSIIPILQIDSYLNAVGQP